MTIKHIQKAVSENRAAELRTRADTVLDQIKQDYFIETPSRTFQEHHLGHTSLVMKIAAYRFLTHELFVELRDAVLPSATRHYGVTDLMFHPIFYLRSSYPDVNISPARAQAFLDSQPHFDRSFGVDAYSFWIALDDIDEKSGGLAGFVGQDIEEMFWADGRNRYDYERYLLAAKNLDPLLQRTAETYTIGAGDILTFDSNALHGATKPISRRRLSFDFRLAAPSEIAKATPQTQHIFERFNENVTLSNAMNLDWVGDTVGAQRILNDFGQPKSLDEPSGRIRVPGALMRWQDEYAYLREGPSA